MYEKFFAEKELIPEGNLIEMKYEDFIRDPFAHLQKIYQTFNLSGFNENVENFNAYLYSQQNFQTNIHTLSDDLRQEIASRWRFTIEQWGYS